MLRSRAKVRGAAIEHVDAGTGAAAAGLRGGTHDVTANGQTFRAGGDIIVTLQLHPGQTVPFSVVRAGKRLTLDVRLGERTTATG